jgi:hypothetical protein
MLTSHRDCRKLRYQHGYGMGASVRLAPGNLEHPTPNIESPTSNDRVTGAHWMFDVGCWKFAGLRDKARRSADEWVLNRNLERRVGRVTPCAPDGASQTTARTE